MSIFFANEKSFYWKRSHYNTLSIKQQKKNQWNSKEIKNKKWEKLCPTHPKLNNFNRYIHKSMYILNTIDKCYVCLISTLHHYNGRSIFDMKITDRAKHITKRLIFFNCISNDSCNEKRISVKSHEIPFFVLLMFWNLLSIFCLLYVFPPVQLWMEIRFE